MLKGMSQKSHRSPFYFLKYALHLPTNRISMRKLLTIAVSLFVGLSFFASCDKGDDNPFGDYKCTCFVARSELQIIPPDTFIVIKYDTVYHTANDMDLKTATSFCAQAQAGYTDTLGTSATCKLK